MTADVTYANIRSWIFLKRAHDLQFVIPQDPPKFVTRLFNRYEQKLLREHWDEIQAIKIDRPIFLIGMPRSGTTMIQDILGTHPQTAFVTNAMHAMHKSLCAVEAFRKRFNLNFRCERYLGDSVEVELGSPNEGHLFLAEWCHIDPYDLAHKSLHLKDFSAEEIETAYNTIRKIIWTFGISNARFLNKNPAVIPHILFIKDLFPDAKFVHIVRDARKCANSMLKLYERNRAQEIKVMTKLGQDPYNGRHFVPYPRLPKLAQYVAEFGAEDLRTTANLWNDAMTYVNEVKVQFPAFYEVRFEDILANPKTEMLKLLDFCELSEVEDQNSPFWASINKIGVVHHTNKYGNFEVVESICRENLEKYNYL